VREQSLREAPASLRELGCRVGAYGAILGELGADEIEVALHGVNVDEAAVEVADHLRNDGVLVDGVRHWRGPRARGAGVGDLRGFGWVFKLEQ
jgi:hypothetical protein